MSLMLELTQEPRGQLLERLLNALSERTASILLVVRDDLGLSGAGQDLLTRLRPFLLRSNRSSSWPGTELVDDEATVLCFCSKPEVIRELIAASDSLYGWHQPDLPEDLALCRTDGSALLTSVCHEGDAYLELTDDEYRSLQVQLPEINEIARLFTPPTTR